MNPVPLAHVTRGELVESTHLGHLAVADPAGALIAWAGDPQARFYMRSSAKPIQALAVVVGGAADRFGLSQRELAVCCGSHSGSAAHVEAVRAILGKIGLDESALACGTHPPGDAAENRRLLCEGLAPSPVHNNCSGKHAGMLATTMALGASPVGYLDPAHPTQRAIFSNLALLSGVQAADFIIGVDGCGAPVIGMPLHAMATAFARLANPEGLPDEVAAACRRIGDATAAEPLMVAGEGGFDTELLQRAGTAVVTKGGAEGLQLIGLRGAGIGIAVKNIDGSHRGQRAAIVRLLGLLAAKGIAVPDLPPAWASDPIANCRDETVGRVIAAELELCACGPESEAPPCR